MTLSITFGGVVKAAAVILVSFLAIKIFISFSKKNKKSNLPYLYREQFLPFLGLLIIVFCLFIWVYSFVSGGFLEFLKGFIVSLLPLFLGLFNFFLGFNWRIYIYENTFVYRNIWRKKKEFKYSEIEKILPISVGGYQIVVGKVKISIDIFVINTQLLDAKIRDPNFIK